MISNIEGNPDLHSDQIESEHEQDCTWEQSCLMALDGAYSDVSKQQDKPDTLPELELASAHVERGMDGALEDLPKLSGEELKGTQYLQRLLSKLGALYMRPTADELKKLPPHDRAEAIQQKIVDLCKEMQKERDAGVMGPATQEAYNQYIKWLQKTVPDTIRELDSLKLAIPPGCPIPLAFDAQGRSMDPGLYNALAADERLPLDLNIDKDQPPRNEQLEKLDAVYEWLAKSNLAVKDYRAKRRDDVVRSLIDKHGLPENWKRKPEDDPVSWRSSAEELVDLSVRTSNYIEAMQSLYKSSRDSDFPIALPRGTKLVIEDSSGKQHTVTDASSPFSLSLLKHGTIKQVICDLPQDLRQELPANREKINRLREWLTTYGDKIDQAVGELMKHQKNKDAVIMFGDHEVANGKAVFNRKGEFIKIVSDKYEPKPNEEVKDFNLAGYDFKVEKIESGPNAGKFKITQTIQAEKAPWYAYQNIRAFGVEPVGKPMNLDERILGPNDFVPVRTGDKIELVKVGNLQSYKRVQQAWYYGEKGLTITMDAAMLVSGTIEVGAAVHGARLAAAGSQAALKLSTSGAAWEVGKGLVRVGVAGSGILNNAGGRDSEWGRTINTARGLYFLGDVGLGLASTGWNLFRSGKAAEAMSTADKVHTIINGRKAAEGVEAIKGIPWVSQIHTGTQWAFKTTEVLFLPVIIKDLHHEIKDLTDGRKRDSSADAVIQVGDGRGLQRAHKNAFDPESSKSLEACRLTLDRYKDTLVRGRSAETVQTIGEIFEKTKTLMAPPSTEDEKRIYRKELLKQLCFRPDEIKQLILTHPSSLSDPRFKLTNQQLSDLMNPDKHKDFPPSVARLAEKFLEARDKDVTAAARIALLYLARDKDGKIMSELATAEFEVPGYTQSIIRGRTSRQRLVAIPARKFEQTISTGEIVRQLQCDLESVSLGSRGIVTGEVLTRVGGLTHQQYGGVLQNVLNSPLTSRDDKLAALTDSTASRMAVVIDGLRHQEAASTKIGLDAEIAAGKAHGLNSDALMKQLERTAAQDKDPDVRAMCAALIYGLREPDLKRRAELLSGFNTLLQQNKEPGEFSKKALQLIAKEMKTVLPDTPALAERVRETKLNAALSLALLAEKTDPVQKEITLAIADSIKSKNTSLVSRGVDALLPDRIAQLQKANPRLAGELQLNLLEFVKNPADWAQQDSLVTLLPKFTPFFKDANAEVMRQLQARLHDLLRNNELNSSYALHYPAIRAASINVLAELGGHDSLDIIRSHVTAKTTITVDGKALPGGEPDATVRLAAVRALEKLRDVQLRNVVNQLLDTETDPSVAGYLRDVRFTTKRVDADSRQWKELYESTRSDLIGFGKKYPYLDEFNHEKARAWVKENFDLLESANYQQRAKEAVDNSTSFLWRRVSNSERINSEEWKAYKAISDERMVQWNKLTALAKDGGEDGNKAKMALYYIATQSGSLMGFDSGLNAGAVKGYFDSSHHHKIYEHNWKALAARELRKLAESNCEGKDVLAKCIKDGLTSNKEVSGYVSIELLDAWRAVLRPSTDGFSIPREELARVIAEALRLETRRLPADQADYYQKALIEDLGKYKHRMVIPVLQAMIDEPGHIKEEVRKVAEEMIDSLMHSTKIIWDESSQDKISSPLQRAERLKKALADKNNSDTTAQEIFGAYKGYKIKDASDPGLAQLQLALNDNSEKVRLCVSKVLMESELPVNHPVKAKAIAELAHMVLNGSRSSYQKEAYDTLEAVSIKNEHLAISRGDRFYYLTKPDGKVQATEYFRLPGKLTPSGYIYPGGASFRWHENGKGEVVSVWEDGARWQRKVVDGKLTNEWSNPTTGAKWFGQYRILPRGEYQYETTGGGHAWTRKANGGWVSIPVVAAK